MGKTQGRWKKTRGKTRAIGTYGMEDASSAMEAATVMTKREGMSHPKTMPTCPPTQTMLSD